MLSFQTDSSIVRNWIPLECEQELTFENLHTVDTLQGVRASRYLLYQK